MPVYKVIRRLDGDRLYEPGEIREMMETDAAHLVASGALELVKGKAEKAEPDLANKIEDALANKAEAPATGRRGRAKKG